MLWGDWRKLCLLHISYVLSITKQVTFQTPQLFSLLLTSIRNDNKVFYNIGTPNLRGIESFFQLDLGQRQKMNKRMNDPRVVQQFLAEMWIQKLQLTSMNLYTELLQLCGCFARLIIITFPDAQKVSSVMGYCHLADCSGTSAAIKIMNYRRGHTLASE